MDLIQNNGQHVDTGEYRIVYRFDNDTVYIAVIGKRNDDEVYKRIKQQIPQFICINLFSIN